MFKFIIFSIFICVVVAHKSTLNKRFSFKKDPYIITLVEPQCEGKEDQSFACDGGCISLANYKSFWVNI